MLGLGPIAFAVPWILGALIVLPVLWWLLRLTPPSPRIVQFPAIRLLRDLVAREETPARTPLWLLIMRLVLAALVILALAQPLLNPRAGLPGSGPIIMVVDNGWGAGRDWPARQRTMADLIDQAERNNRDLIILATAPDAAGEKPQAEQPAAPRRCAARHPVAGARCHGRPTAPPCWKRCGGFRCRDRPIRSGFPTGCPMAPHSRWRRGFSRWAGSKC